MFERFDDQFDFHLAIDPSVLNLESLDPGETLWNANSARRFNLALKLHRRRQAIVDSPAVWDVIESIIYPNTEHGEQSRVYKVGNETS